MVSGLPGKDAIAVDWEKVLSRLSVPGITLLLAGVVLCAQATRLCRFVLRDLAGCVSRIVSRLRKGGKPHGF